MAIRWAAIAAVMWLAGCGGVERVPCVGDACSVDAGSDSGADAAPSDDCSMCSVACGGSSGPVCYGRNGAPCPASCSVVNWLDCEAGSRTPPRCD